MVDTDTVIVKSKNIHKNMFICTVNTTLTAPFGGYLLKVSNFVLEYQEIEEAMRNCNMPFSEKNNIYKKCFFLMYYGLRNRLALFAFDHIKSCALLHNSLINN